MAKKAQTTKKAAKSEVKFKDLPIEQQITKLTGDSQANAEKLKAVRKIMELAGSDVFSASEQKGHKEYLQEAFSSDSDSAYKGSEATILYSNLTTWLPENKSKKEFDSALNWFIGFAGYQTRRLKVVRSKSNATVSTTDSEFAEFAASVLNKTKKAERTIKSVKEAIKQAAKNTGTEDKPKLQFTINGKTINAGTVANAFTKCLKQAGEFAGYKYDSKTQTVK